MPPVYFPNLIRFPFFSSSLLSFFPWIFRFLPGFSRFSWIYWWFCRYFSSFFSFSCFSACFSFLPFPRRSVYVLVRSLRSLRVGGVAFFNQTNPKNPRIQKKTQKKKPKNSVWMKIIFSSKWATFKKKNFLAENFSPKKYLEKIRKFLTFEKWPPGTIFDLFIFTS